MAVLGKGKIATFQPDLFLRSSVTKTGTFIAISLHEKCFLAEKGLLSFLKLWVPCQNPSAKGVHKGGGSVVETAAVRKTVLIDFKIHAGIFCAVHSAAPFEDDPHVIPIEEGSLV